jgi:hypothetical protein
MKRTAWILLLLLGLGSLPAMASPTTLRGDYRWGNDSPQSLEASFTAAGGKDSWYVSFYFRHAGEQHTYRGTAQGSLTGGELRGTVKTEDESRTFSFECTFQNGTCRGSHYEVSGNRRSKQGTLSLKAVKGSEPVR